MSKYCEELHKITHKMHRIKFPFEREIIPDNGVYLLFEKGELGHSSDRIVRVGSHRGDGNLRNRINEHFLVENKDRSIFRKNIGRAILNRNNDDYINIWELNITSRENKEKFGHKINVEYQENIETMVTEYIRENFSFAVIEMKEERLYFEKKLISEISNCMECKKSKNWLGNYSTKYKIIKGGLWQVNHLFKEGFSDEEFFYFKEKIESVI